MAKGSYPNEQLRDLEDVLIFTGHKKGSPRYEAELLARRVSLCKEAQSVPNCSECPANLGCTLASDHLRHIKYGVPDK